MARDPPQAAGTDAKALRSVASVFAILAARDAEPSAGDEAPLDAEDAAALKGLIDSSQPPLDNVRQLGCPPAAGPLRAAAAELGQAVKQQRAAVGQIVRASQTARGRRALSRLGETIENIEQGALERRAEQSQSQTQ